jgi:hypothetical protein
VRDFLKAMRNHVRFVDHHERDCQGFFRTLIR